MDDLLTIMRVLRSENGCPWDKVQTHESIRMNFVEEVYEALEAIDQKDAALLREELGDVLLQVVFHARIEEEKDSFDFSDVVNDVCCKLIVRHPHIFGNEKADTIPEVLSNWNDIKRKTKGQTTYAQTLSSVAKTLPGLMRAAKVQSRAAKAGVLAEPEDTVIIRMQGTLSALVGSADGENVSETQKDLLGSFLFDAVRLIEGKGFSAEELLERKTDAYISYFAKMEQQFILSGKEIKDCDPQTIHAILQNEDK